MSQEMTITEALAEINTITKRLSKKRAFILENVAHPSELKDPLEKQGGSAKVIAEERQSIRDLEIRLVSLRRAISAVNAETLLTVEGEERSLADWLVWRREIAPQQMTFLADMAGRVYRMRRHVAVGNAQRPVAEGPPRDLDVHVDETWLQGETDRLEQILGALDGKLSLINATTRVEI